MGCNGLKKIVVVKYMAWIRGVIDIFGNMLNTYSVPATVGKRRSVYNKVVKFILAQRIEHVIGVWQILQGAAESNSVNTVMRKALINIAVKMK